VAMAVSFQKIDVAGIFAPKGLAIM